MWEALETDWRAEKEEILNSISGSLKPVELDIKVGLIDQCNDCTKL